MKNLPPNPSTVASRLKTRRYTKQILRQRPVNPFQYRENALLRQTGAFGAVTTNDLGNKIAALKTIAIYNAEVKLFEKWVVALTPRDRQHLSRQYDMPATSHCSYVEAVLDAAGARIRGDLPQIDAFLISRPVAADENVRHANALLVNRKRKEAIVFEPFTRRKMPMANLHKLIADVAKQSRINKVYILRGNQVAGLRCQLHIFSFLAQVMTWNSWPELDRLTNEIFQSE